MSINYVNLLENWQCVVDAAAIMKLDPPDWRSRGRAKPAASANHGKTAQQSYCRRYLNAGTWGQDEAWTDLAECLFACPDGRLFAAQRTD